MSALPVRFWVIRDRRVILDFTLAELYGVTTRRLNEQVRRNRSRFPHDFLLELTPGEFESLKSQFATSSWGGRRKLLSRSPSMGRSWLLPS